MPEWITRHGYRVRPGSIADAMLPADGDVNIYSNTFTARGSRECSACRYSSGHTSWCPHRQAPDANGPTTAPTHPAGRCWCGRRAAYLPGDDLAGIFCAEHD